MFGAIIGDIVGSIYGAHNIKTKDFPLFQKRCFYTDGTVMTAAVAQALLKSREQKRDFKQVLVEEMQNFGHRYSGLGYGGGFKRWLDSADPQPYNSYGNGSAMRVSPCGLMAVTLSEALSLAKASAEVTHNHPEGIKGAQAVAGAVFLAKYHKSKEEIKNFILANFYDLDQTLDEIRPGYRFNKTCQQTVPQALQAFLESESFEDAIRNAVSIGGDSGTVAAITGSIAWAYYNTAWKIYQEPESCHSPNVAIMQQVSAFLPEEIRTITQTFNDAWLARQGTYYRVGGCSSIPHTENKNVQALLGPEPICLDDTPLRDRLRTVSFELRNRLCEGGDLVETTWKLKLRVKNYNDYWEQINAVKEFDTVSLEMCMIYLTYLWRSDYWNGGYPEFWYNHREEVRAIRRRILDLLFEE